MKRGWKGWNSFGWFGGEIFPVFYNRYWKPDFSNSPVWLPSGCRGRVNAASMPLKTLNSPSGAVPPGELDGL